MQRKSDRNKIVPIVLILIASLAFVQLFRYLLCSLAYCFVPHTDISHEYVRFFATMIVFLAVLLYAKRKNLPFDFFPQEHKALYAVSSMVLFLIIISTFFFNEGITLINVISTLYASLLIPLFEELLFRGLVWEKLKSIFKSEWTVYVVVSALFGLWHIGYIDSILFKVGSAFIGNVVFWKVITGFLYGLVTGLAKKLSKNTLCPTLLHSFLNTFAR